MKELYASLQQYKELLGDLASRSADKGNLYNAGLVLDEDELLASAESWVVSSNDATAHSERMLVESVCKHKHSNLTPGLTMVTIIEPCVMCVGACSWAEYKEILYFIPADKYIQSIPWVGDGVDKQRLGKSMSNPVNVIHIKELENHFSMNFESAMKRFL